GGPLLVHKGALQPFPSPKGTNASLSARNPRTALGFNFRNLYLAEVDGRQKTLSVGMTFAELAALMKSLGCTEAMNLDGGGSSTFWLDGRVVNSPSDKHERAVANAVAILRKKTAVRP
ncbi:MAG: copper amine oxidase, partial [Verrucomicrobia bacterium]